MNKLLLLFFLLIATSFPAFCGNDGLYDVYLLIGQSNMAGRGQFEAKDTIEAIEGVWLLDSVGTPVPAVAPLNRYSSVRKDIRIQGYNPGIEFSRIMRGRSGKPILLVVNARGGSHIKQWQPGAKEEYFEEAVERTLAALKYGDLKAILWHQGETDVQRHTENYPELFQTMISELKKKLGVGNVPVVLGQIGQWNWAERDDIDCFNDSILPETVKLVPNSTYVSSRGLKRRFKDNERDPHFGREAQQELGRRYADAVTILKDSVYIAKFKNDRKAAISFTFDDGDEDHALLVAPELEKRGFRGTFWVNGLKINKGDSVRPRATWNQLRMMAKKGHEISNHSYTHGKLVRMDSLQVELEVQINDSIIEANVGVRPLTFCYPFNATTPLVKEIASRGRVGTRMFQTAMGQANNKSTEESLQNWLNNLLDNGEWSVTMIHGITKGYDKWNNPQLLWNLFDKVKSLEDSVWVDTFKEISTYREERDNTSIEVVPTDYGMDIKAICGLDRSLFNEPLTIVVKGDWEDKQISATCEGMPVPTEVKGDKLLLNASPYSELIRLEIK